MQFRDHAEVRYSRIAEWDDVDHGRHYDAYALMEGIHEEDVHVELLCSMCLYVMMNN